MKILVSENEPLFKYGFTEALKNYGVEVKHSNLYININKGSFESLIQEIKNYKPDLFLNAGTTIYANTKKLFFCLKYLNIPYVYWAIDDPVEFSSYSIEHGKNAALVLTPAIECIKSYKNLGINASFLPFGCNTRYHYKGKYNPKFNYDLIFIGNNYRYTDRINGINVILKPLIERNYNIKIFGNKNWFNQYFPYTLPHKKFYGGFCNYRELPDAYATAKIALGLHSVTNSNTMMSMRTFEVLGCEGFYLSQYAKALEYNFKNETHLVWSKNADTTLKLVDKYLSDTEARKRIASVGHKECYLKHNYDHMVKNFINELYKYNIIKS